MHGYQLTFFTQQDREHKGCPLGQWLVDEACRLGIGGATLLSAATGYGRDKKLHSAHFIELGDQPIEVTMAVTDQEANHLFERLNTEDIHVFYIKTPIEFGMTGAVV